MATITKRGPHQFQVQIRRTDYPPPDRAATGPPCCATAPLCAYLAPRLPATAAQPLEPANDVHGDHPSNSSAQENSGVG